MDPSRPHTAAVGAAVLLTALLLGVGLVSTSSGLASASPAGARVSLSSTNDYINVSANDNLTFYPNQFAVYPGAMVHLVVIQKSTFAHTFDLSSVANYTIPSTDTPTEVAAFFSTHPPLVNLSLAGANPPPVKYYDNFTAPHVGTYEYVCTVHFPAMTGVMTSEVPSSSPPPSSGSPNPTLYYAFGLLAVGVVAAGVALAVRRRNQRFKL